MALLQIEQGDYQNVLKGVYEFQLAQTSLTHRQESSAFGVNWSTPGFKERVDPHISILKKYDLLVEGSWLGGTPFVAWDSRRLQSLLGIPLSQGGRNVYFNDSVNQALATRGLYQYQAFPLDYGGPGGLEKYWSAYFDPSQWRVQSGGSLFGEHIWDSIMRPFGNNTSIVEFLNPISGVKAITKINNSSETDNFFTNFVKPQPVNYGQELIKGGLNVVGTVGLAFGVEGVTSAYGSYASSTLPLSAGAQGPTNPGFWGSLSQGNFLGAWDNLVSPLAGIYHSPQSIFPNKAAAVTGDIGIGQLIATIVDAFGKVGRGVANLLSGNVVGGIQTFTTKTPTPGGSSLVAGPSYSGSSGGGGGFTGINTGQTMSSGVGIIALGVGVLLLLFLFLRRKG